ncbi:MAG: hemoglobin [Pseudohongiellaceae bacterium]|jgi:hemoglobin
MNIKARQFGEGDYSYKSAGELSGLIKLVNAFFESMDTLPEAKCARDLYPKKLSGPSKKLAYFLSGWLGGPRIYQEHFGEISIPSAHRHLKIGQQESDAWMLCMQKAVDQQAYEESFKEYLIAQLQIPAGRIVIACSK